MNMDILRMNLKWFESIEGNMPFEFEHFAIDNAILITIVEKHGDDVDSIKRYFRHANT